MGQGKNWSQTDLEKLQEMWGEKTIPQIARSLGRTNNAVKIKATRLGLGGQTNYGGLMSARGVSLLLGVDIHAITDYWIPKCGLKGKKTKVLDKGTKTIIHFDDLVRWLKCNQDKWDSRKVELYALGQEYDWLQKKRQSDKELPTRRFYKWSPYEDSRLISMFRRGIKIKDIAAELGRSYSAVEHRLMRLDVWGTGKYVGQRSGTK